MEDFANWATILSAAATFVSAIATVFYVIYTRGIVLANRKMAEENVKMVEVNKEMVKANQATLEEMRREFNQQNIPHLNISIKNCNFYNGSASASIYLLNPSNISAISVILRTENDLNSTIITGSPGNNDYDFVTCTKLFAPIIIQNKQIPISLLFADDVKSLNDYIELHGMPIIVVQWENQTESKYIRKWQLVEPPKCKPNSNDNWSLKFLPEESTI